MNWKKHFKDGTVKGLKVMWELVIIVVPIYMTVSILKDLGVLEIMSRYAHPLMAPFGLPQEASIVMVMGYFLNIYAAVGAASAIHMTWQQLTTIGLMLCVAHSLPLEGMVVKKVGIKLWVSLATRLGVSFVLGGIMRLVFLWIG